MVLSNAIIFISIVLFFVICEQRHSKRLSLFRLNLKVYCLVLVEVHRRRALLSTGRFELAL